MNTEPAELKIHKWMVSSQGNCESVALRCINEIVVPGADPKDFEIVLRYLNACGFAATFWETIAESIRSNIKWTIGVWAIISDQLFKIKSQNKLNLITIRSLLIPLKELAAQQDLMYILSEHLEDSTSHSEIRSQHTYKKWDQKKKELFAELAIFKSQNMREQLQQALSRLEKMFPSDPDVQRELNQFQRNSRSPKTVTQASFTNKIILDLDAEISDYNTVATQFFNSLKININSQLASDLVISFLVSGAYEVALKIASEWETKHSQSNELYYFQWLKLDCLMATKNHSFALEYLETISRQQSHFFDTPLRVSYYRGLALWALDQKEEAILIMETLLRHHENFRDAATLVFEWRLQR